MHAFVKKATLIALFVAIGVVAAAPAQAAKGEPDRVVVQHILIKFKGAERSGDVQRSRSDAKKIAKKLLAIASKGDTPFEDLQAKYSEDRGTTFVIFNEGVEVPKDAEGYPREQLAFCFGDVSFRLDVGEIDLATHHVEMCPFGYHIIKRIE